MESTHIFSGVPVDLPEELIEILVQRDELKIERIVSRGHSSPSDFWYDQEENEWILVLSGKARLQFLASEEFIELGSGDFIEIPAHSKHRVDWTDPDQDTVWLAIFYV